MIQDIAIEQLDIHPQNVRKVYTDIDELNGTHELYTQETEDEH